MNKKGILAILDWYIGNAKNSLVDELNSEVKQYEAGDVPDFKNIIYTWEKMETLIRQLIPYLQVKKLQARFLIEFIERDQRGEHGKRTPTHILEQRIFFHNLIHTLNNIGDRE